MPQPLTPRPIEEREAFPGWPPRDFLQPFVLLAVSLQRAHGYAIEDYLRGFGLFGITMSTLYRTLRQMEKDGFLESTWEPGPTGPARRVYTITGAGDAWLDDLGGDARRLSRNDRQVLRSCTTPAPARHAGSPTNRRDQKEAAR